MCKKVLYSLVNNKKLQFLKKVPQKYYYFIFFSSITLFLIMIFAITNFDLTLVEKDIFILLTFLYIAIGGFFYTVHALMDTLGNIEHPFLAMNECVRIFGGFVVFVFFLLNSF